VTDIDKRYTYVPVHLPRADYPIIGYDVYRGRQWVASTRSSEYAEKIVALLNADEGEET
jgi:hypothetical protein